ncbi:hypothetical protein BU23DRAFT_153279 [Bimuria novae-zelandiae CBS 107.79]|uniref:Uncharacterized protein n=1 Tax=Bimuria novae-zelandiae CBS 107.79 TaxID=1447943 RepID=A0A6A5VWV8_9PLEO|nr:hypothetical protein BU23DRAFT_153279 [Bimuria novae-zelandiae CBS 107.79]
MVWAISQDDSNSTNAMALMRAAGRKVMQMPDFSELPSNEEPIHAIKTCRFSNCGESCDKGWEAVPWDGNQGHNFEDASPCFSGQVATFCCPGDQPAPKCKWKGLTPSGDCNPGCDEGEVEVGTQVSGCNLRHQSACCSDTSTTNNYGRCKWFGSADLCSGAGGYHECEGDYKERIFSSSAGFGGEQTCTRGAKSYCCKSIPKAFTNCV